MLKSDFRLNANLKEDIKETSHNVQMTYAEYCRLAIKIGHEKIKDNLE